MRRFADGTLAGTFLKVTGKGLLRLGNLHAHRMQVTLLGGIARKCSRLITWPGASAFSGAGALAIAIVLSATSALAVTIALSAAGVLAVAGTLDHLVACAFIGTSAQDVQLRLLLNMGQE